ncbi:MAG: O-antigen ligase family protein [Acidobacteriota bacterium]
MARKGRNRGRPARPRADSGRSADAPPPPRRGRTAAASEPGPERLDAPAIAAVVLLAIVLAGTALRYDSGALSSFDAPKRLVALVGAAAAALAAFGLSRWENPFRSQGARGWRDPRIPVALAAAALALTAISAVLSPRPALALDSLRATLLIALLLPLGASRVVARGGRVLAGVFLASSAINAGVSILQARALYHPFSLVTLGGRQATGAYAGNVGYLALATALAAVAALAIATSPAETPLRIAAGALTALFAVALVINQNLTSLTALVAGGGALLAARYGRRALFPAIAGMALLAAAVAAYPPMRNRAAEAVRAARSGDWDGLLSYRTGAWAAAARMARERPLVGYGPGTFESEYVTHRLAAEIPARRRFVNPLLTSSYAETHNDYLQPFAEEGAPAALAAIGAAILVAAGVARAARSRAGPLRSEAVLLFALLAAGATAALTWFPLQRPITAVALLLALGRAWRLSRDAEAAPAPEAGG